MILNELSIQNNATSLVEIKKIISELLKVCHRIFCETGDLDFYYTENLLTGQLMNGYTIHDWFKDPQVPQNEKAFLRSIINRKQLIEEKDFLGSELRVVLDNGENENSVGCLMAYETESYVVSMNTSLLWQTCGLMSRFSTN